MKNVIKKPSYVLSIRKVLESVKNTRSRIIEDIEETPGDDLALKFMEELDAYLKNEDNEILFFNVGVTLAPMDDDETQGTTSDKLRIDDSDVFYNPEFDRSIEKIIEIYKSVFTAEDADDDSRIISNIKEILDSNELYGDCKIKVFSEIFNPHFNRIQKIRSKTFETLGSVYSNENVVDGIFVKYSIDTDSNELIISDEEQKSMFEYIEEEICEIYEKEGAEASVEDELDRRQSNDEYDKA